MRQSARIKSGKVVSKYSSSGSINKKPQVRKINKIDGERDNNMDIEPEGEIEIENDQRPVDNSNVAVSETQSSDTEDEDEPFVHEEDIPTEIEEIKKMDKESALSHIKTNYSNPESIICYSSVSGLKSLFKILTEEEIKSVLSTFETWSLMKSSRDPKKYNPFIAQHLRDVWQIDCITMRENADQNLGIKHLFCAIDVFR